jgi:hypothetical protein
VKILKTEHVHLLYQLGRTVHFTILPGMNFEASVNVIIALNVVAAQLHLPNLPIFFFLANLLFTDLTLT